MSYDKFKRQPTPAEVARLSEELRSLDLAQAWVAHLTAQLAEAQRLLKKKAEVDIPTLLDQMDMRSVTLRDGTEVALDDKIVVSPRKDDRDTVVKWLSENGGSQLVARDVIASFQKGVDGTLVRAVAEMLKTAGADVVVQDTVHPSSLRSFVTKRMEEGAEVPEFVGAFRLRGTKIQRPVFDGEAC